MILAKDLKRQLDRKRKERDEKIRQEIRQEINELWMNWNNRRMEAESRGEPFDEPPPDINNAVSRGR